MRITTPRKDKREQRNSFYLDVYEKATFEYTLQWRLINNFTFSDWRQIVELAHEGHAAIENEQAYVLYPTELNKRVLDYLRLSGFKTRKYANGWEIGID